MNEDQQINARISCAQIKLQSMIAANLQRSARGQSLQYVEDDFMEIISDAGIHSNAVLSFFEG